jgi:hypothetical protein
MNIPAQITNKTIDAVVTDVVTPERIGSTPSSIKALRKSLRISKRMIAAVEHIADLGGSIAEAARAQRVSAGGLSAALERDGVREYITKRTELRLSLLRSKATVKVDHLMSNARSELVQLEAAKTALAETKPASTGSIGDVFLQVVL